MNIKKIDKFFNPDLKNKITFVEIVLIYIIQKLNIIII